MLSSAAVTVSLSRTPPWMNSASLFFHAGFPPPCVFFSRLSSTRTSFRLMEHDIGAPVDSLEQFAVQLIESNQIVTAVIRRPKHNVVAPRTEKFDRFRKTFGRNGWTVGIDQANRLKSALE